MGYIVGYREHMGPVRQKHCKSAGEALDFVSTLTLDDGEVEYLQTRDGHHMTLEELRKFARDEAPATDPPA